MASIQDISVSAVINLISAVVFLLAFAIVRLQPINDRVYFPKWYLKGIRPSPRSSGTFANKFVNLDFRTYIRFLNWMPAALKMPEQELIDHAGLDSAVYIRIYLLGFWAHVMMAYVFTFWTFYILYKEYKTVSTMRLHFSENRRPDQFTVLVKNVPPDPDESVDEHVEHFFRVNHPDHYLSHQVVYNANKLAELVEKKKSFRNWLTYYQTKYERNPVKKPKIKTGFWGLWGKSVDAIDYYMTEIEKLSKEEAEEREKVISDPNAIVPAAFVSFKSRWGAAVCAQTQQSRNSTIWLTEWAPEPRDVYWDNLSIPYIQIAVRRLLMAVALFFLTFFFMIPIGFVQAFASIDGIKKVLPFLKSLIEMDVVKSFVQGFLPGIVLKIFLILLPMILMTMSKIEGFTSLSSLDRRSASKYHLFVIVNVFFGSIITGAAFQQLQRFLNQSPTEIPKTIGVTLPMKATFFITFIMVDGWAGIAAEILRLVPLVMFHIKNTFLVKTEHDREQAMDPGSLNFSVSEPRLQLYFLLGLVYSVVTPILLPFIIVFFAFAYMVFRHQIINVYDQKYESGASFWPDVNRRILIGLVISQLLLIGLLSTKDTAKSTPLLIVLIVLTIWFHKLCKGRFESVFVKCPLQDAVVKDTIERSTEPNFNLKEYLHNAYLHPVLKVVEFEVSKEFDEENNPLVATKRISQWSSKTVSNGTAEDGI
ncbi:PREDICTED: CSC1-like protein At4g02900 isoform X2 [Nicotiana attenuata]|uniref:CSC1-like protein At4g02900 isoform X2 n=1 Tax=Nicotiana attenuata TaxID=49451 RepID=UPI00090550F7|nr:PREDICTED: CSC1-like protein At4g02900 isoform X2 [Nicotiana attenuata]